METLRCIVCTGEAEYQENTADCAVHIDRAAASLHSVRIHYSHIPRMTSICRYSLLLDPRISPSRSNESGTRGEWYE